VKRLVLRLRPIVARPGRLVASVLGVAVGVAAVIATVAGSGAAVASLAEDVETLAGPAVLEVRGPGGVRFERLEDLAPIAAEVDLVPVVEDTVLVEEAELVEQAGLVEAPGDEEVEGASARRTRLRVLGLDLVSDRRLREAETGDATRLGDAFGADADAGLRTLLFEDGAFVPRALADELDLAEGEALRVLTSDGPRALPIVAVFDPGRLSSPWARTIVVDIGTARVLFGRGERFDRVELVPRGEPLTTGEIDALAARTRALLDAGGQGGASAALFVEPPSARRAEGERLVASLRFNLTALSGVSMLVGIALVATTLATSVVQRRDRLALMRSLGASRAQLAAGVLGEAAVIGIVGGALGVLLGALGASSAVAGVESAAYSIAPDATSAGAVEFELWWLPFGVLLGLGAALLAAALPLKEAVGVPPIQNLRSERPTQLSRRGHLASWGTVAALIALALALLQLPPIGRRPVFALTACIVLLAAAVACTPSLVDLAARVRLSRRRGVALRLAQAALASSRGRAAWAAGAVAIAVGLAVAMATMVGSFRRTVVEWTDEAMTADLFVSSAVGDELGGEVVRTARALFGADRTSSYRQADARFEGERVLLGGSPFAVNAGYGNAPMLGGTPTDEAFESAIDAGGVIVNEPFARRFDRWPGDTIALDTAGGPLTAPIVAVAREYAGQEGRVFLDEARWLALHDGARARSLSIYLPDGADFADERERFLAALDATAPGASALVEVVDRRGLFDEVLAIFDRTFAVTIALQILSSIAAALAVVTVLGALVRERRFDLAVVRVVGAARSQVATLVLGEAFVLGAVGTLAGVALGATVGYLLVTVVNVQSHGWSLAFVPPVRPVLVTFAAVVPACVLAGLPPALGAMVRPPREVLRETG